MFSRYGDLTKAQGTDHNHDGNMFWLLANDHLAQIGIVQQTPRKRNDGMANEGVSWQPVFHRFQETH